MFIIWFFDYCIEQIKVSGRINTFHAYLYKYFEGYLSDIKLFIYTIVKYYFKKPILRICSTKAALFRSGFSMVFPMNLLSVTPSEAVFIAL